MTRKERLIGVFKDTEQWYQENGKLAASVKKSIAGTKLYPADSVHSLPAVSPGEELAVSVTKSRSFEAAMRLARENPGKKIAVHNFASATRPGGGVTRGSIAQEECLCRCSTLYPVLSTLQLQDSFYGFHKKQRDVRYTDTCIYSPGILIVKSDIDFPERLPESDWQEVDVITCAAPNLRPNPYNYRMNPSREEGIWVSNQQLLELHMGRARHMLTVAAAQGAEILVLGAFGCGVFQNDPYVVAQAYKNILPEFSGRFVKVEFAVYCSPQDLKNYETFRAVMQKINFKEKAT